MEKLQTDGMRGRYSDKVLGHCLILLEAQRDELKDAVVYMERGRYPALSELLQASQPADLYRNPAASIRPGSARSIRP
jgi:hypothetical protein